MGQDSNNNGGGMFGGDGWWAIILFAMIFGWGGGGYGGFGGFGGFNAQDIDLSDILGDLFGGGFGFGGGGRSNRNRPTKGRDSLVRVNLTFEEAVFGCKKSISLDLDSECEHCNGKGGSDEVTCSTCGGRGRVIEARQTMFGMFQTESTCPDCNGKGKTFKNVCRHCGGNGHVIKNKEIDITVPEGVDTGHQLRISGKGAAGYNGGPNGDIYIEFRVKDHPIFERKENDIYLDVPITVIVLLRFILIVPFVILKPFSVYVLLFVTV